MAWSPDGSRIACLEAFSAGVLRIRSADDSKVVSAGSVTDFAKPGSPLANISGLTWFNHGTEVVLIQNGSLISVRVDGSQPRNADNSYAPTPMLPGQTGITAVTSNAAGTVLAFTQNTATGTSVTVYDTTKPAASALQPLAQVDHATQPALSPDGRYLAYVPYNPGQNVASQVWLYDLKSPASASNPRQVTSDPAVSATNPTWAPDGTRIAFTAAATTSSALSVKSFPVTDPSSQRVEVPTLGFKSFFWRPLTHKPVERLAGGDRVGTAVAASQSAWENFGGAGTGRRTAKSVTLSRSDLFADALGGAGFAAHQQGPLLLTDPKHLDQATMAELRRVLGPGGGANGPTVYLLGGDSALSPDVQKALVAANYHVDRIGGANRFDTAVKIAQQDSGTKPSKVLVATGIDYPDALAAGAAAGANANAVVVLTNDKKMPPETAAYLNSIAGATVYGVGGQAVAALGGRPQIPLKGADRVATSLLVARNLFDAPGSVGFATSMNWPDSLAGGALQGTVGGPLILVSPTTGLSADEQLWLTQSATAISSVQIYGGPAAVPSIETEVGTDIGGVGGFVIK
ncbi:cell wall-binding repeat-containing protein [Catenulispora sp. GP43]|uniref:cell wall-binding repeat-containing protein n=1 Tax=Catenulispora sp. GP43 TaxID=3156263 RepID=UPI0035192A02